MNISRLGNAGGTSIGAAGQAQRTVKSDARVTTVQTAAKTAPSASSVPQGDSPSHDMSPRIAAYADKINARLEHMIDSKKLSPRQTEALSDAKAKFNSMMHRLSDAFSNEAGVNNNLPAGLDNILHSLTGSLSAILRPVGTDKPHELRDLMHDSTKGAAAGGKVSAASPVITPAIDTVA